MTLIEVGNQYNMLPGCFLTLSDKMEYLIVTDTFGRKFKLEPVTNENIKFPFIITPLFDEVKK